MVIKNIYKCKNAFVVPFILIIFTFFILIVTGGCTIEKNEKPPSALPNFIIIFC